MHWEIRVMKSWIKLSAAGLAVSLLMACGGGSDTDPGSVTPLSQLQPGERFAMETPLLDGSSQIKATLKKSPLLLQPG